MTTDAVLNNGKGYYDITWNNSGDIDTDETLDTAILMSLFEEARATSSEIPASEQRRGWIGNETTPSFEQGSKAWEFEQERITGSILAELGVVINNSLSKLVEEGIAVSVSVLTPYLRNGTVIVPIDIGRDGSQVERKYYPLWDNTGKINATTTISPPPAEEGSILFDSLGSALIDDAGEYITTT
ncbi:MAG: hypothetical protein DRQ35_01185 [Gammaproteobacteria bacterium]|nr:MAG: hypothetical protein DRQ35_01185 [Gammaproteobacteria bacterium]